MKILISIKAGMIRSVKSWKGIMIVWLFSLLLVSIVAIPIKSSLNAGFGNSMITEKLASGINVEVFADLGAGFRSLMAYFRSGLFMALLVGFLINSFLSGGLFHSLKGVSGTYSSGGFFTASAKYFWAFFVISLIISLIVLLLAILIVIVPVSVVSRTEGLSEGAVFKTGIIATTIFLMVLTLLLLVADYARAWLVYHDKNNGFIAIGFGFSRTFRTFFLSYPLMLIILSVHLLFGWLVLSLIPGIEPVTGAGIFMLFIITQLLFIIKILIKVWRYASVTKMMELNSGYITTASPDQKEQGSLRYSD